MKTSWIWSLLFMMSTQLLNADTLVIAHRGNSSEAPENTLAAVRSAANLDPMPSYIEIDIHQSLDGVLVVSHDFTTDRTSGVSAVIREKPFDWIRTLNAGYTKVFGDRFNNEKFPSLEEVLDVVKDKHIGIMIECKQLLLEDQVVKLLQKRNEVDKHVLASFDKLTVYRAKKLEPSLRTLYLAGKYNDVVKWEAKDLQADILGLQHGDNSPEEVSKIQQAGFDLWLWTIDDKDVMRSWVNAEVNGIITNRPADALSIVEK